MQLKAHSTAMYLKGPRTIYILSIFLKQHNFLLILIVISPTRIMSTQRNLHFKSTIYEKSVENEPPFWQADGVTGWTCRQCKVSILKSYFLPMYCCSCQILHLNLDITQESLNSISQVFQRPKPFTSKFLRS